MKKILLLSIFLVAAGCQAHQHEPIQNNPVACTQEAKLCPDGSYVGRSGPNCEFSACPVVTATPTPASLSSGITGKITIGPTCAVQPVPSNPSCDPQPYQATVIVKTADGQNEITRFTSKADGTFKVTLNPGNYLLVPVNAGPLPRGSQQSATVEKNKFTQINLIYDSGIR